MLTKLFIKINCYLLLFLGNFLPKKQKQIIFESFHGKQFSDNPRAIYEYIQMHYPEYKLYWSADRRFTDVFIGKNVKYVRRLTPKWLYIMARSKYWVVNSRLPMWIKKPNNTVYIQTWHGTPLKKLGVDIEEVQMPDTNTEEYKRNFVYEANKWDYLISPNRYSTNIFNQAFQYKRQVIESGYPRNDYLLNQNNFQEITRIKSVLELPLDKKVILYAPTWRDNQFYSKGKYKFDLKLNLDLLQEDIGEDYVILLRMHYLVSENLDLSYYKGFVFDFSNYEDIRELYLISDLLITDYSSVFFDYANLKRPILFYVYDLEDYRDNLRGFYFDLEREAPGPLLKNTEEIISTIKDIEKIGFEPNATTQLFYEKFCYLEDGSSTKRVVEKITNV